MNVMDKYVRQAVRGAIAMMQSGANEDSLLAYHFAVGLLVQTDEEGTATMPEIVRHGIATLHGTAHAMAEEGAIALEDYSTQQMARAAAACSGRIQLMAGAGAP